MSRSWNWIRAMPWSLVAVTICLMAIGLLGIARSQQLAATDGRFIQRQAIWALLCVTSMLVITLPSYRVLAHWSYAAYAVAIVLLVAVYAFAPVNGAQRWIRLGPVGLQPSEFAKVGFVLALARWLVGGESYRRIVGLAVPVGLALVPVLLIVKEPDLGTALVFFPVMFTMLYAAGARRTHLALLTLAAVAAMPLVWSQMSREQKSRVTALASQTVPGESPTEDGYHLHQAKAVLAQGGWLGSFAGGEIGSDRARLFVPEAHTDSIAVVLGERFGLIGWAMLLLLFWLLIWRGVAIAEQSREPYGRLVTIGVMAMLATQVVINVGMLVGLLPITGLTLPLVSYGGSSLLANSLALGLVLNIAQRPGYEVTNEPFVFSPAHAAKAARWV